MVRPRKALDHLELATDHFNAFTSAFVNDALASRWRELFAQRPPAKWPKVQPWKLWEEEARVPGRRYVEVARPFAELQADASFSAAPPNPVVAIGLGHSTPTIVVKPFHDLLPADRPLEGIISLDAGRQVLVINHDGDVLLCAR